MHVSQLFDLTGQVALVTGGSRGLGLEMATGLAEAGAAVVLTARRSQWLDPAVESLRQRGFACEGRLCDVTQPEQVERCIAQIVERTGQLHILINSAGIAWGALPEEMPLEKWRAVLDVNATGTFLVSQSAGKRMLAAGYGRIITIASIAGLLGSAPGVMSAIGYTASKGAVIALTRDLATHWARAGITVNAVAPGFFPTRLTESVIERSAGRIVASVPMGRLGASDDLKGVAVFLASRAAAYITGQVLAVDGGATAW